MTDSEEKAYKLGQEGKELPSYATYEEKEAYEKGKQSKPADPMKAFMDLLKVVVDQLRDMGVSNWKGYLAGLAIFFESMFLLGALISVFFKMDILFFFVAMFGGGFIFMLQKIVVVRTYSLYAYPGLWLLALAGGGIAHANFVSSIVPSLAYAAISFGIHYLFSLGFVAKKSAVTDFEEKMAASQFPLVLAKARGGKEGLNATILLENKSNQTLSSVTVVTYWKDRAGVTQNKEEQCTQNISVGEKREILNTALWRPRGMQKSLTVESISITNADGSVIKLDTPPDFVVSLAEAMF